MWPHIYIIIYYIFYNLILTVLVWKVYIKTRVEPVEGIYFFGVLFYMIYDTYIHTCTCKFK